MPSSQQLGLQPFADRSFVETFGSLASDLLAWIPEGLLTGLLTGMLLCLAGHGETVSMYGVQVVDGVNRAVGCPSSSVPYYHCHLVYL